MSGAPSLLADGHLLGFSSRSAPDPGGPIAAALGFLGTSAGPEQRRGLVAVRDGEGRVVERAEGVRGTLRDPTAIAPSGGDEIDIWVATALPPGVLALDRRGADGVGEVVVATDSRAIGEAYAIAGDDWAMVATSPLLLAAAAGAPVDEAAVLRYARLGHFLGDDSPWQGIRRLAPGEIVRLVEGRIERRRVRPSPRPEATLAGATTAVIESAGSGSALEIELSGGLDSRLALAACVAVDAPMDHALTLGSTGDPDMEVATGLAARLGLEQRVIDLTGLGQLDVDERLALLDAGASDRGWVANPIDTAPLDWVEARRGSGPGVSGQNGEIARGFYHRGPHARLPRGRRVRALATWRLFTNAGVRPDLFAASRRSTVDDDVIDAVGDWLDDSSADAFLRSTDDFYLRHRMTRWVGPAYAGAGRRHPVVAPFLSAGFILAAARLDVATRRRSTAVAAAVVELAPELASIPLAGGPTPVEMADRSLAAVARSGRSFARKAARKLGQRVGRSPVRPSGTDPLTQALAARVEPLVDRVADDPLVDREGLVAVRERPDPRELAFLVSLVAWRHPRETLVNGTGLASR